MTDEIQFSSDLVDSGQMDSALADLEKALAQFERIVTRHSKALSGLSTSKNSKTANILSSLARFSLHWTTRGGQEDPSPMPMARNSGAANSRFPVANGQLMADLASMLQRMSGRNL